MNLRFEAIKDIGCIAANRAGLDWIYAEIHHLNLGGKHGGKRLGDAFTVGLSPWSHRGVPFGGWTADECRRQLGPSLAIEPDAFRAMWTESGNAEEAQTAMLAFQEELLARHHRRMSIHG